MDERGRGPAVIGGCATHVPLRRVPAHVIVLRRGQRLDTAPRRSTGRQPGLLLSAGDQLRVSRPGRLALSFDGNRYRVSHGVLSLACRPGSAPTTAARPGRVLAVDLQQGRVSVASGPHHPRRAIVVTPEMVAWATSSATHFHVDRNPQTDSTRAVTLDKPIVAARGSDRTRQITARVSYTAISDRRGLRLDVWPFSLSPLQRAPEPRDRLPEYWADGSACAVGCAAGQPGWPLRPFHQQHAIRAGIDELRPANFHVAVDIQAYDRQPVYAIQSGVARRAATASRGDHKVTVGSYTYWHVVPAVARGQHVTAYRTIIGRVEHGFKHVALEQGTDDDYLNPLRPGGPLRPYTDTEPPVIGQPRILGDGHVIVGAFDPQSFIRRQSYETPVLAPAALAWRLYTARGRPLTRLKWALRSTGYISPALRPVVFAPGAANPGFGCFYRRLRCIPNWVYNLAGGLTPPLPLAGLRGRYRLTVYAWDFKGNESALDDWITLPLTRSETALGGETGPLSARFDP